MCAGKNGEYSLTRDVDEALSRALADVSKPFVDSKDDGLAQFQAQTRIPDSVVGLNDDELMKHIASVLFCRNTSPTEELTDGIGELSGALVSSDLQALATSSSWGHSMTSIDCDSLTAVTGETKLATHRVLESASIHDDPHAYVNTSSVASASSYNDLSLSSVPPMSAMSSTVTVTTQSIAASSLPALVCSCMPVQLTSEANTVLSTPMDTGMSLFDSVLTGPILQVGSFSALPQVLVSSPASLLASSSGAVSLPTATLPSVQSLPDVQTLMKPSSWRYVVDSRPLVTSSCLSALPLASIFTPFSTAFCPPPPASSSSVVKMDHPLASATVLATAAAASCGLSTACSPSVFDTVVSSVVPPVSLFQAVTLPTCSAVSPDEPLSGT